jgi:phosphoglycerol transferase
MVGHTAGVPLKVPEGITDWQNGYGKDGHFLPGLSNLQTILAENGYYQTLMVGSNASFGGRKTYYETHNVDKVYDLYTARKDGIVSPTYFEWWGMEDLYLYEYAKQELTEIAQQDQPFAFTMLTVDTHHVGGYACAYCGNETGIGEAVEQKKGFRALRQRELQSAKLGFAASTCSCSGA